MKPRQQKNIWEVRTTFKPFMCSKCGGDVKLAYGPGRKMKMELYRNVPELELEEFPLPTCEKCGETYVLPELEDELQWQLQAAFDRLVWKRLDLLEELLMNVLSHGRAVCDVCHKLPTRHRTHVLSHDPHPFVQNLCDHCLPELETTTFSTTTELIRSLQSLRRGDG